jgi:hypothetical protein
MPPAAVALPSSTSRAPAMSARNSPNGESAVVSARSRLYLKCAAVIGAPSANAIPGRSSKR